MPLSRPMVILKHETPDGEHHFDWLFAVDEAPDSRLLTFRLPARPMEIRIGGMLKAVRLPDHRRIYLDYEGPISGGRGMVTRVGGGCWWEEGTVSIGDRGVFRVFWDGDGEKSGVKEEMDGGEMGGAKGGAKEGGGPQFWWFDPDGEALFCVQSPQSPT